MADYKTPLELAAAVKNAPITLPGGGSVVLPLIRLSYPLWRGVPVFGFGRKPTLDYDGAPCFAELAIARDYEASGANAVWISTYGGLRFFRSMPQSWRATSDATIPDHLLALIQRIWKVGYTTGCFDVLAWRRSGEQFTFVESKRRGRDRLTKAQLRFIEGALACGVAPGSLLIAEWEVRS